GYRDPGRHGVAAERRTRLHSRCRAFSSRRGTGDHGEYADPVLELDRVPEALTYRVPPPSPPAYSSSAEPSPSQGRRASAAARPSGQLPRKSHQPQPGPGLGGKPSSGAPEEPVAVRACVAANRSSASAHSAAIS